MIYHVFLNKSVIFQQYMYVSRYTSTALYLAGAGVLQRSSLTQIP